jgi:hypothetical protein
MSSNPLCCTTLAVLLALGACGGPRTAVAPEPEPAPGLVPEFPHPLAWTNRPHVPIRTDAAAEAVPLPFTRLNVLGVDTLGLRVRCLYCIPAVEGWVARDAVVAEAAPPRVAAAAGLAEFVLAVREAAGRRDEAALHPVMATDFTFSLEGGGGPGNAFRRWEFQGFRALDNLPPLLDRGLATRDSVIWAAPPAFVTDPEYRGPRAGFRRNAQGRWEWIFLVGG